MLLRLRLENFVLVDAAELDFADGFTVLSGETGAGKSILLDALALVLGARADAASVRTGSRRADIVAEFAIGPALDEWLHSRDLDGDAGVALLRRVVEADGRSRAFINGHPATAGLLRELGGQLVEIHGQHASQSLLRSDGQRQLLDDFGAHADQLAAVEQAWRARQTALQALARAEDGQRELSLERERIAWQLEELDALRPDSGEWEALENEHRRLAHAAGLADGAYAAAEVLVERDDALGSELHRVIQRLRALAAIDPTLNETLALLDGASIQIGEAASFLREYATSVDLDPARMEALDARIGAWFALARKLRLEPEQLHDEWLRLQQQMHECLDAQDIDALRARMQETQAAFDREAATLTRRRRATAARLASAVTDSIAALGMADAEVLIVIDERAPGASGSDQVEFRIAPHAGAEARPLAKIASGGELSRIALAITAVAAQANAVPTLVFDEADAGVGGAIADAVGERMRVLGQSRQVLCVTHLPQVAAKAHHHWRVLKTVVGDSASSAVEPLTDEARVEEIARMLGGARITPTTRRHASEMLTQRRD